MMRNIWKYFKILYLSFYSHRLRHIQTNGLSVSVSVTELKIEKATHTNASLRKFISGNILNRAWISRLVLLQISVVSFPSVTCHQIWSLIVSRIYFFCITTYSLTLMLACSLELANKWHLWRFLFKRLFLNNLN